MICLDDMIIIITGSTCPLENMPNWTPIVERRRAPILSQLNVGHNRVKWLDKVLLSKGTCRLYMLRTLDCKAEISGFDKRGSILNENESFFFKKNSPLRAPKSLPILGKSSWYCLHKEVEPTQWLSWSFPWVLGTGPKLQRGLDSRGSGPHRRGHFVPGNRGCSW